MSIYLSQIGMDSEYFLVNEEGNFVPVCGLIGGTKAEPIITTSKLGTLQEDNVMAEIGVTPTSTLTGFQRVINDTINKLEKVMASHKLSLSGAATARFETKSLASHDNSNEFGCTPDINCWTKHKNQPVTADKAKSLRTAGGHVHISLKAVNINNRNIKVPAKKEKAELVKFLDVTLGAGSVLLDYDYERRKLYGKAGSFRFTEYKEGTGIEYRVLSNFWTFSDDKIKWVYDGVLRAIRLFNKTGGKFEGLGISPSSIQRAINSHDEALSKIILTRLEDWESIHNV
jgi:hypothetical protein